MVVDSDKLLTIQQVMCRLQVSDETVYRHIRLDKLRAIRVGGLWRISEVALGEFLETGTRKENAQR